jgi:hypothetical protein
MYGSGVKTGIIKAIQGHRQMAVRGSLHQARIESFAAAAGSTMPATAVQRTAATAPAAGTTIWASALRGQCVDFLPFSFLLFYPFPDFFGSTGKLVKPVYTHTRCTGCFLPGAEGASAKQDADPKREGLETALKL